MNRRSIAVACAVGLLIACGGAIEPPSDRGGDAQRSTSTPKPTPTPTPTPTASSADPPQASPKPPPPDPGASDPGPAPEDCSSFGTHCQTFDPGGPDRWGCNTLGPQPQLACEH